MSQPSSPVLTFSDFFGDWDNPTPASPQPYNPKEHKRDPTVAELPPLEPPIIDIPQKRIPRSNDTKVYYTNHKGKYVSSNATYDEEYDAFDTEHTCAPTNSCQLPHFEPKIDPDQLTPREKTDLLVKLLSGVNTARHGDNLYLLVEGEWQHVTSVKEL